jgi:hypothetical protein
LAQHYLYYLVPWNAARVAYAVGGIQQTVLAGFVMVLLFKRVTDWRVTLITLAAMVISLVENALVGICGSWYAFVYSGPSLKGDKCELMTGFQFAKPLAYTLFTLAIIILPRIWKKPWMVRNEQRT